MADPNITITQADPNSDWGAAAPTHTWTDADRPQLLPETDAAGRLIPMTTQATEPDTGGGVGRDLAVGGTRALGTPGDIISDIKPYVLDPAVNFLHNRLGIPTGPEIPIPTTEAQRSWYEVAGPQDREERIADDIGQGVGTAATVALMPTGGVLGQLGGAATRGGAALSAGFGSLGASLSQEYFPDSLALQLIASGLGGFGSAAIARQLLFGSLRSTLAQAGGVTNALVRDYIGRAIGAGVSHLTGLPEVLSTELGGLAGVLSHNVGRAFVRNVFSRQGMRSVGYGLLGGVPPERNALLDQQNWGAENPRFTGGGLQ